MRNFCIVVKGSVVAVVTLKGVDCGTCKPGRGGVLGSHDCRLESTPGRGFGRVMAALIDFFPRINHG
jgi:hypothetical protein